MTLEAKVGFFTVVALALAFAVIAHLGGFTFGKQPFYTVEAAFKNVDGLKPGAKVEYAGVKIGSVETIKTQGTGAVVTMKLRDLTKVPENSIVTITSDGLMGEKLVSIYTKGQGNGKYLKDGSVVMGTEPPNLNELMNTANKTLDRATDLLASMNAIVGNKEVQQSLIQSAINLRSITQNMNEATGVLAQMAKENHGNVDAIVVNLRQTTAGMNRTMGSIEQMVNQVEGNGELAENIKATVVNMKNISQKVEKMAANLEPVLANPQTASDVQQILNNTRSISVRANKAMNRLDEIKVKANTELLYGGKKKRANFDAQALIYPSPDEFLLLGGDGIGSSEQALNLQLGHKAGAFTYRIGMIDGHAGVGTDIAAGRWGFSADAYDFGDFRLKLRGQYCLSEGLYLVGQVDKANRSGQRETYFGLRKEF